MLIFPGTFNYQEVGISISWATHYHGWHVPANFDYQQVRISIS